MTLLIFDQWETGVDIYTDTIVTTAAHEPIGHSTKVWTFPHLRIAIAVTGTAEIAQQWAQRIAWTPQVVDIVELDTQTTRCLNEIHADLTADNGDIGTSTVYMFGFAEGSDELRRYVYRSTRNYESEPPEPTEAFAVKPAPTELPPSPPTTVEGIVALAMTVRDQQADPTTAEHIPIGGQLIRTRLTPEGITAGPLHTFPDDHVDWAALRASALNPNPTTEPDK